MEFNNGAGCFLHLGWRYGGAKADLLPADTRRNAPSSGIRDIIINFVKVQLDS